MDLRNPYYLAAMITVLLTAWVIVPGDWIREKHNNYNFFYKKTDEANKAAYINFIDSGIRAVGLFFGGPYKYRFDIYVHPDRQSLDSQWRKDWKMPEFKSECWMVASGVAAKLDAISPKAWDAQSCEHSYTDKTATQQIITHELIHVYHGQFNISGNFDNIDTLDWFVEGLASYAPGQCNEKKLAEIKNLLSANAGPKALIDFYKGKLRYALSGSLVMYIDHRFGRSKLKGLLQYNKNSSLLAALSITEPGLLQEWKKYIE